MGDLGTVSAGARRMVALLDAAPTPTTVHVTKFADRAWNPTGPAWTGMCVDASTLMAARLAGADLRPLARDARARTPQELLLAVRQLALGSDEAVAKRGLQEGLSIEERARALAHLGIRSRHTDDVDELFAAVRDGRPVIWNGWAGGAGTWHARIGANLVAPDGHHAVAVSRDARTGGFVVNDPNSRVGPLHVTAAELRAFSDTPPADFRIGGTILEPLR